MPDMDLDPDPNNSGRTGPGRVYDEQLPEHPELTALKLFIEAGHYRLNTSITQQFARLSQEIQVLAFAAQNSQGRSTANNASASGVSSSRLGRLFGWTSSADVNFDSSSILDDVERKICELQSANKSLIKEAARAEQEKKDITKQTDNLQKRLAEVEDQKQQLQKQNTKYRDIFIKHGQNDDEPMDAVVIKSFCDLREQIQRIVQKQYSNPPNPIQIDKGPLFEEQKAFFKMSWMHQSVPNAKKILIMRAQIFKMLQVGIFQRPNFGLGGDLEKNLANFEEELFSCAKGNASDIHEWRRRTVECANWLGGRNKMPRLFAEYIATFMEPLCPEPFKDTSPIHFESIRRLCEDAYKLALVLRKSTSDFKCESMPCETVIDDSIESQISPQAFDPPPKSQAPRIQGSRIVFTIFGALVKYEPATGERYVLEKSHVVCCE